MFSMFRLQESNHLSKDNEALRYSVSYTLADNRVCNSNTNTAEKGEITL